MSSWIIAQYFSYVFIGQSTTSKEYIKTSLILFEIYGKLYALVWYGYYDYSSRISRLQGLKRESNNS